MDPELICTRSSTSTLPWWDPRPVSCPCMLHYPFVSTKHLLSPSAKTMLDDLRCQVSKQIEDAVDEQRHTHKLI